LTKPTSRSNQAQTTTGCRGPACLGPCDRPLSAATRASVPVQRGATLSVQWPRNNHAGGFIRLAWAPKSQSDSAAAFDAGVEQITCHEIGGCHPDDPSNPNGGDSGPADGSSRACSLTVNVPTYLTDGEWTLQWAWFGGAFALGDYYSCVDYAVSGGPQTTVQPAAVFKGGDYTYPGQNKCKYFNTDRLHRCVNEPCNNPITPLNQEESGPAFGIAAAGTTPVTPAPTPVTPTPATPAPTPVTPAPRPPPPSTPATPAPTPATPAPTPATPAPTPSGGACVLGHQKCTSTATFQTCGWASQTTTGWSVNQACPVGLGCHVVQENYVWCY